MKLQTLTVQAFGPYKQKQTIDFEALNKKQLFLITGPTGSGKTTIFDAITFALFGRSSGDGREADGFISQHRSPDDVSFVELTFTLKGQTYTIYRQPKQILPRVRGKGYVEKASEAKLTINDEVYSAINEVNKKIIEILGIDDTQFRQIVMLPQGEFRKLLEAKSSEKEQIFRKIFKTDDYKLFQDLMRQQAKAMEQGIRQQEIELKELIEAIDCYDDDELEKLRQQESLNYVEIIEQIDALNERLKEEVRLLTKELKGLEKEQKKYEEELHKGSQLNKRIDELNEAKQKFQILKEKEETIKRLEKLITQMEEAKFVFETEKYLNNLTKKISDLTEERKQLSVEYQATEEQKNHEKAELNKAYEAYQQLDRLKAERNEKLEQREKVSEWTNLKASFVELEQEINRQSQVKEQLETEKRQLESEQINLDQTLQQLESEVVELQTLSVALIEQKNKCDRLKEAQSVFSRIRLLVSRHREKGETYHSFHQTVQEREMSYQEHYHLYLKSQAGILAKSLADGDPCPVCGSTHHPKKATLLESVKSKEELDQERQQIDDLIRERQDLYQAVLTLHEQLNLLIEQFNDYNIGLTLERENLADNLTIVDEQLNQIIEQERTIHRDLEEQEKQLKQKQEVLNEYKDKKQSLQEAIKWKIEAIDRAISSHQTLHQHFHEKQGQLKALEENFKLSSVDISELDEAIETLNEQIETIDEEYHSLEKQYNETLRKLATLRTKIEGIDKQFEITQKEKDEVQAQFETQLRNANFSSEDEYRQLLDRMDEYPAIKSQVETYHHEWQYYQKVIPQLETNIGGKEKVDLDQLQRLIDTLEAKMQEISTLEKEQYAILRQNQQLSDKINQIYKEKNKQIETFEQFNLLNKVTNGDNVYKLTFERYVLTAYFDEIIHAANLRLRDMTERRYTLLRDTEYTGGRGHQGLDLLVFDSYTNQKRSVKTLSGGESFIASLSLALGLADIVASYAGGIQLDTIFIDEGFGSLDPVALDHAISTLNNLKSSGRTVGIISHVQELRERIDAQIEIVKTKEGSFIKHRL